MKTPKMPCTSKDITVRMKRNVLSWFGHAERIIDAKMAKKVYDRKVSGKSGRARPRLTFENTISKILKEGRVKTYEAVVDNGRGERGVLRP